MKSPVVILALTLVALLSGCASQMTIVTPDPRDPLESINRATYAFNDGLDRALVKPVAQTYARAVPKPIQTGVSNFFSNAKYPVTLANNILQGKFTHAANDVGRLLLNTTLGLGAFWIRPRESALNATMKTLGRHLANGDYRPVPT